MKFLFHIKWRYLFNNFDLIRLFGRCYYFIAFFILLVIDFLIIVQYNFELSLSAIMIIFGILTFISFAKLLYNIFLSISYHNYKNNINENIEHCSIASGVPGSGKTSSRNHIAVLLAKKNWRKLRRDYWRCLNVPKNELEQRLQDNSNEIIKAYNYAIKNIDKFVPCLFSMQTIYVGKRQSFPLTKSMLLQKTALPYLCVLMVDEIGFLFPNKNRVDNKINAFDLELFSDFCRFIRHFLNGYLILTEQDFSKAYIDIRRVVGENIDFTKKQKWLLKPSLLLFIYELTYSFFDWYLWKLEVLKGGSKSLEIAKKQVFKSSKRWAKFMSKFAKLISCIGYRRYAFERLVRQESEAKTVHNNGRFYLPAPLNCQYNDRVYRNAYKAKEQEFKEPQEQTYYPSKEEIYARFNR